MENKKSWNVLNPFPGPHAKYLKGTDYLLSRITFLNRNEDKEVNLNSIKDKLNELKFSPITDLKFINEFPALYRFIVIDGFDDSEVNGVKELIKDSDLKFSRKLNSIEGHYDLKVYQTKSNLIISMDDEQCIEYIIYFRHFHPLYNWISKYCTYYNGREMIPVGEVDYSE